MSKSEQYFDRARKVTPGGVNSPVRAFKSVGGSPRFISSANGCELTDVDGDDYIDYIGSWGPMILGHAHPEIKKALTKAIGRGTSYGAPSRDEVILAEMIVERIPSVEMIRFVNSGTEATMSAVRLARAATGRNIIIKFAGGYHGHADSFLIQAGSGVATFSSPDSPGVTHGAAQDTLIAEFNDLASVWKIFDNVQGKVGAIIVEPVPGNMGVIPPDPGFLQGLRDICDQSGAVLIFDEVMTGFRIHPQGAQGLYGIMPDLSTFGKIIGGGLPVGAYGGKAKLMSMISPQGPVYQAGTLSGNPLAMTAGIETLKRLTPDVYDNIELISAKLEAGLNGAISELEVEATVQRVGSMLTLFFHPGPVKNFNDAKAADHDRFARFFNLMLENGIHLPPSGYEAWFISAAHTTDVIYKTIESAHVSLKG